MTSKPVKGIRIKDGNKVVPIAKKGSVSDQIKRRKSKKVRVVKRGV